MKQKRKKTLATSSSLVYRRRGGRAFLDFLSCCVPVFWLSSWMGEDAISSGKGLVRRDVRALERKSERRRSAGQKQRDRQTSSSSSSPPSCWSSLSVVS